MRGRKRLCDEDDCTPSGAVVQEFETEEEMLAAHEEQFPEQYESEE